MSSKFSSNSWLFLIIFLLPFVVYNIITSRLNEIQLDKISNSITLIYKNHVGIKRALKYDLPQIEFTYKRQATSLLSGVKNVCTIYSSKKEVVQSVPENDNWSDGEIRRFVYGLIESDVKRRFIGYSLKDVEI